VWTFVIIDELIRIVVGQDQERELERRKEGTSVIFSQPQKKYKDNQRFNPTS
jgi:hypothetical protein